MCNFNPKFLYVGKKKCSHMVYVQIADDLYYTEDYRHLHLHCLDADLKLDILENL